MSSPAALNATVKITVKDINNNSVAKQFNSVSNVHLNFFKGTITIYDVTGEFIFTLTTITSLVDTIVSGVNGQHTIVMS